MATATFYLEGIKEKIHCNINNKMKDIINKFLLQTNMQNDYNKLQFLYNGSDINYELSFFEQANEQDKIKKRMKIMVNKIEENKIILKQHLSKDLICPECIESALIEIKDFKLTFYGCKNNHKVDNFLLNEFEETQMIDLNSIICHICYKNYKSDTHNNEFYLCNTCNKNICPLCLPNHDKKHKIINYDDKNYVCKKHNEMFVNYCKTCKEDICIKCEYKHYSHDIFDLNKILFTKNERIKMKKKLKNVINKFKDKINVIKELLDMMTNLMDHYYKINEIIINNYNTTKRNFNKFQNLFYLYNNNEKLIQELNEKINENNLSTILEYSFKNFYDELGEKYVGEKKNGLKDGKGVLYYDKDNSHINRYEGDFKNDKIEGKGIMFWNNGDRCEEDWKNEKKNGKGIYYHRDGDRYEGEYENGKVKGKGRYYWNCGDIYEGDWEGDTNNGKGTFYFCNGDIFKGEYKNGKKEGKGIYRYNNGERYEGEYKNGKTEGKGKFYYKNGSYYEGDYKDNKIEGRGIMIWKNGDRYEGEWKDYLRDGKGTMYYNNGRIEEGLWKKDKFIGK